MAETQWGVNQQMRGMLAAQRQLPIPVQWQLDLARVILKGNRARLLCRQGKGLYWALSHRNFSMA
jgi:hypothetical protein